MRNIRLVIVSQDWISSTGPFVYGNFTSEMPKNHSVYYIKLLAEKMLILKANNIM